MAEVFSEKIQDLPVELQYILLDDLVTAFECRLSLFHHTKAKQVLESFEFAISEQLTV